MSDYIIYKYLRLSSEDADMKQAGKTESNSIGNQRNLLDDFIRRTPEFEGARVVEFCDDGWSGKNFERPAVTDMLEQVRKGKANCIIVKDLSRFGRDYLIVGNYLTRVFPFLGVRFIAVNDGFDSIRPQDIGNLESSFKTLLNDYYSRDLSRKVRSAKRLRAERGCFLSPFAPYGFVKDPEDKNKLLIDPDAAETVRRIFQTVLDGFSTTQIARALNDDLIPTPMLYKRAAGCSRTVWPCVREDNFWTHNAVAKILRDERYIGKNVYGKRTRDTVGHWHNVKVSRSEWIVVDDTHEGIVTREEYDAAQARLREFAERDLISSGGTPLYKKVRCGVCGHLMTRVKAKSPYYICRTSRVTSAYSCTEEHIPESDLLDALLDGLRVQAMYAVEAGRIWEEQHLQYRRDTNEIHKTLSGLKETCRQTESTIRELYEGFALGELDKASYLAAKSAAAQRRDDAAARIRELEAELENTGADGRLNNRFVDCFQRYAEVEEVTAEIVTDVLQEIVVYPDHRLNIVWNYREDLEKLLLDMESTEMDSSPF